MCPIWKKRFFDDLGGFNERFPRYQDPEIHIRALTRPGMTYRMFMDLPPDAIVIPSEKNHSVQFALSTHASLLLLVPQTYECLERVNSTKCIRHMEGYLKDWLKFFAHSNFIDVLHKPCGELLLLFHQYQILSSFKMWLYRKQLSAAFFLMKTVRYLYLKVISWY